VFEKYGIELEYMIVGEGGQVLPIADEVLRAVAGEYTGEVECGPACWSNELVLHVLEMKTNGPAPELRGLGEMFGQQVRRANELLAPLGGRLMPTGMHPTMDPHRETRLWPHECNEVYTAFDRIFGCQGHGWSNLQSMHINLPFADVDEFGRLHAAIRLVLPILPALAASSPIVEGRITGLLDSRLDFYRVNCRKIPSLTGRVIPEAVFTPADYEREILQRLYRDVAPYDADGILQDEWVNARGAIARFCRNAIEIRLIDVQECPQADLAIAAVVVGVLQTLVAERWSSLQQQQGWAIEPLEQILLNAIREGESAVIDDAEYLRTLGHSGSRCTAGELWAHLIEAVLPGSDLRSAEWRPALDVITREGTLARRILRAIRPEPTPARIGSVYRQLAACLAENRPFLG
jgi:glutamate---cysteine ligase / carboxylate-amine ligase